MNHAQNIKAIFFDIDGTLLSGATHSIPPSAAQALRVAHSRGYRLFLATGRHPAEIRQVPGLAGLPFSGTVAANGQYCTTADGTVVHSHFLPPADVRTLQGWLRTAPCAALYSRVDGLFVSYVDDMVRHVCHDIGTQPPPVGSLDAMAEQPILQAGLYLGGSEAPDVLAQMPGCFWTRWHSCSIDIAPIGGGKWVGAQKLAAHFGFSPRQIMAVGDNDNDVDMLESAAYSVAMGNGTLAAKHAATRVTAAIDEDGLAQALLVLPGMAESSWQ